jgi:hypothetical protein
MEGGLRGIRSLPHIFLEGPPTMIEHGKVTDELNPIFEPN